MVGGKFAIGLNETALGIVAPRWFMDTMINTIPIREAELALTTGRMFSVEEALKVSTLNFILLFCNSSLLYFYAKIFWSVANSLPNYSM